MTDSPVLVWFRRDLRLADNAALHWACASARPVIPVYIWAPEEDAPWEPGGATKWWNHHALESLSRMRQLVDETAQPAAATLKISGQGTGIFRFFSTHPPLEERMKLGEWLACHAK